MRCSSSLFYLTVRKTPNKNKERKWAAPTPQKIERNPKLAEYLTTQVRVLVVSEADELR